MFYLYLDSFLLFFWVPGCRKSAFFHLSDKIVNISSIMFLNTFIIFSSMQKLLHSLSQRWSNFIQERIVDLQSIAHPQASVSQWWRNYLCNELRREAIISQHFVCSHFPLWRGKLMYSHIFRKNINLASVLHTTSSSSFHLIRCLWFSLRDGGNPYILISQKERLICSNFSP